jgi:HlyD family secretion protein
MNMNQHILPRAEDIETALGISRAARRWRMTKRVLWVGILLLTMLGGAYWYFGVRQAVSKITYVTQPAQITDLVVTVTATGTVQPITQVDVGSELSGTIKSVNVTDNTIVKKGDVLASLDVVRLSAQRDRAAAQLAAAEARLQDTLSTAKQSALAQLRQKRLRVSGVSTDQELEAADAAEARATAAVAVAKADIQSAKADLSIVETDLAKSSILSPIDGIVLKSSAKPGQTVAASLQAPVLFTLADNLSHIQIEAAVDEADVGQVKKGQKANFSVDAFRGRSFKAEVGSISFSPDKTDGVVTYKTVLAAPNDDLALRPGMTTTTRIVVNEIQDALTVPNEALRYVPAVQKQSAGFSITQLFMPRFPRTEKAIKTVAAADGTRGIWVLRDGAPVEVRIKTGLSDGKQTAITGADIRDGDAVIISARATSQ